MLRPVFILILFLSFNYSFAQSGFSKNSIKFGIGYGSASFSPYPYALSDGNGAAFNIGFQRNLYKDRLRFNPDFKIGSYKSSKHRRDGPLSNFISYSLHSNFYFDILKYKAFSIVAGSGPFINYNYGFTGNFFSRNYKINHFHMGGFIGTGLRIAPKNKRLAAELSPINLNFGTNKYFEYSLRFGLDYKLK